eukprot:5150410-Amphidinium_carterae.1
MREFAQCRLSRAQQGSASLEMERDSVEKAVYIGIPSVRQGVNRSPKGEESHRDFSKEASAEEVITCITVMIRAIVGTCKVNCA